MSLACASEQHARHGTSLLLPHLPRSGLASQFVWEAWLPLHADDGSSTLLATYVLVRWSSGRLCIAHLHDDTCMHGAGTRACCSPHACHKESNGPPLPMLSQETAWGVNRSTLLTSRAADQTAYFASRVWGSVESGSLYPSASQYLFLQLQERTAGWAFWKRALASAQAGAGQARPSPGALAVAWSTAAAANLQPFLAKWAWPLKAADNAALSAFNLPTFAFDPSAACGDVCTQCCIGFSGGVAAACPANATLVGGACGASHSCSLLDPCQPACLAFRMGCVMRVYGPPAGCQLGAPHLIDADAARCCLAHTFFAAHFCCRCHAHTQFATTPPVSFCGAPASRDARSTPPALTRAPVVGVIWLRRAWGACLGICHVAHGTSAPVLAAGAPCTHAVSVPTNSARTSRHSPTHAVLPCCHIQSAWTLHSSPSTTHAYPSALRASSATLPAHAVSTHTASAARNTHATHALCHQRQPCNDLARGMVGRSFLWQRA